MPRRRPYIEITPTKAALSPRAVQQAMEQLYARLERATRTGWRERLMPTRSTARPSVEWLLVADGTADTSIRALVGVTETALLADVQRILRTCLPDTYELRLVEWHPADLLNHQDRDAMGDLYREPGDQPAPAPETSMATDGSAPPLAGVEYLGRTDRKSDWRLPLTPFAALGQSGRYGAAGSRYPDSGYNATRDSSETARLPLTTLVETLQDSPHAAIYQVLARPKGEWAASASEYRRDLETGTATLFGRLWEGLSPRTPEERREYQPTQAAQDRIDGLASRDTTRSMQVTARAVVVGSDGETGRPVGETAESLATALTPVSGAHHRIEGRVRVDARGERDATTKGKGQSHRQTAAPVAEALCERRHEAIRYGGLTNRLRRRILSPSLLVTPAELPGLCLLDGSALTPTGHRALGVRDAERTGIALPPPGQLRRYRPPGMALVRPLTSDRQPLETPLVLPPEYQARHQVIVGDTGAGKSVLTNTAMLSNRLATAGPQILFDHKGGGTAREYLQAHFKAMGSLDDVLYFDLARVLPAFSFFDIQPLLEAGLGREEARSRKAGHYAEILKGVMPPTAYESARESTEVIHNHLRALYDPVHGRDVFAHSELYRALQRTQGEHSPPVVSDDRLEPHFTSLLERDSKVFARVLGGAISRVERIATDGRLAPLFDHVPAESADNHFRFQDLIDEECVIVFDFGGMERKIKQTLTLVILSNLWTALKARAESTAPDESVPQVTLYLEEAKDVAATPLVDTLLAQGRSFDLSVLLGVQFLEQLDSPDPEDNTYREALNETATFVVGNVSVDRHLPSVLATADMSPQAVERRLGALERGEWLVRPGAGFGESPVRPFLGTSLPAPPGHPASSAPLSERERRRFGEALQALRTRTRETAGIPIGEPAPTGEGAPEHPAGAADTDPTAEDQAAYTDSLLPYTKRVPECIFFDAEAEVIRCGACEDRFTDSIDGLIQAIECCQSIAEVDVDDIPICDPNLKLSPTEIEESAYSLRQLLFMQVVYNVQQRSYERPEYDLRRDSMVRIQEYVGIETEAIEELIADGLVTHDTDRPYRLYSVRPAGRSELAESHRHGSAYGHGAGDLDESTEHVLGVDVGTEWLERTFVQDPDSDVVSVQPYFDLKEGSVEAGAFFGDGADLDEATDGFEHHRLDLVGLDADGEIVVTMEVERINHDTRRAVPSDYDKMAACNPEHAIWLAMSHADAHEILGALNDPLEGEPRVEKTYAESSPASAFLIDEPGFTDIYTLDQLREEVLAAADADADADATDEEDESERG